MNPDAMEQMNQLSWKLPSWELTFPLPMRCWVDDFPFPQVGLAASSIEGRFHIGKTWAWIDWFKIDQHLNFVLHSRHLPLVSTVFRAQGALLHRETSAWKFFQVCSLLMAAVFSPDVSSNQIQGGSTVQPAINQWKTQSFFSVTVCF